MSAANHKIVVLGFPEYREPAQNLAAKAGLSYADIDIHHFPDGESKLTLPATLSDHVIICRSLDHPNEKLLELILAADGARAQGVKTLTLVAPYLSYMRQDCAFHPGEVVSQKALGRLLAQYFDQVITVDAHLHRIHDLAEALPVRRAVNLTATQPMREFLQGMLHAPLLLGPDEESAQWVASIAKDAHWEYAVARKKRYSDTQVKISLPDTVFENRNIVLVDDVASTGKTLINTARALTPLQPASINVLVTHALFSGNSFQAIQDAGVSNIWSCDSIPHPSNRIQLAELLSEHIQLTINQA